MQNERKSRFPLIVFLNLLGITLALLAVACTPAGPGTTGATDTPPGPEVPAGDPVSDLATLDHTEWWLADIGGEAVDPTAVEAPVSLGLYPAGEAGAQPEFSAQAFCNSLGGTVHLDADRVFDVTGQTDFTCEEQFSAQDEAVISAVEQAATLHLIEGHLVLLDESGEPLLRYRPKPEAVLDPALDDTEWILTSLRGQEPLDTTRITLDIFGNQVGGTSGCNSYGAEIRTIADGTFDVAGTAMTEMACEGLEGVMAQEGAYIDAFTSATAYRLEGDTLTLLDEAGEPLLTYIRQGAQAADPATLVGSAWRLATYNGEAVDVRRPVTLIFGETRYWGQSECRGYVGTYQVSRDDLVFPGTSMLGESCPDEQLLLPENGDYQFVDGRLTITSARGDTYTYDPLSADSALPLAGTEWQLLAFVGSGDIPAAVQESLPETAITATFDAELAGLTGNAGCNEYGGAYEASANTLSVGELVRTEMFCMEPEGVMDQEDRYLSWLAEATGYQSHGTLLWLEVADGRALLFTAAAE